MKHLWSRQNQPPKLFRPPREDVVFTPLAEMRRCRNRGCRVVLTGLATCVCGVPTVKLGGDVCEHSNGNGSASNGKKKTRTKAR